MSDERQAVQGQGVRQPRFAVPAGATQLLLVRHGESAPIVPGVPQPLVGGQADPALDPVGVEEARKVAERLAGEAISAIYRSPLQRTGQTAAPLAAALGIRPEIDEDLREVYLGRVDGQSLAALVASGDAEVTQAFRDQRWEVIEGAESHEGFSRRVRDAIERIAGRHAGDAVALFVHGGVIGEVMAQATGSSAHAFISADNASISHLVVTRSRWIVRSFNDTGHLRDRILL